MRRFPRDHAIGQPPPPAQCHARLPRPQCHAAPAEEDRCVPAEEDRSSRRRRCYWAQVRTKLVRWPVGLGPGVAAEAQTPRDSCPS